MDKVTCYGFEIWQDHCCLTELKPEDGQYKCITDAEESALEEIQYRIDSWKEEDTWRGETEGDFEIKVTEKEIDSDEVWWA